MKRGSSKSERVVYIDVVKGFAILLVVLGHILQNCELDRYIYSFHMPLFFLLSGITFSVHEGEGFVLFVRRKFCSLMVPYYSFGLIAITVFLLTGHYASATLNKPFDLSFLQMCRNLLYGSSQNDALKFYEPLWFLPCLFSIHLISYFIVWLVGKSPETGSNIRTIVLVLFILLFFVLNAAQPSAVSSASVVKVPIFCSVALPMGLNMAIREIPFFLFGIMYREYFLNNNCRSFCDCFVSTIFIAVGVVGYLLAQKYKHPSCLFSYYVWVVLFYIEGFFSSLGYIFLCRIINSQRILSLFGRETISILVLHKYPVVFVSVIWPLGARLIRENNLCFCFLLTIIATIVSMVVGLGLKRYFPFLFGIGSTHVVAE